MRKTPKNRKRIKKGKKIKVGKTIRRSQKKLTKGVVKRSKSLNALSRAKELFASLSLTPREEHELLQNFFVSALEKGIKKRGNKSFSLAESIVTGASNKDMRAGLLKADEKIGRALHGDTDIDGDEEGVSLDVSNLKYAQPKYKNVESILKYNETPDDKGGVKLVIMNFND